MNYNRSPYSTEYPQAFTESSLQTKPQSHTANSSSYGLQLDVHPQSSTRYLSPSDALDRHNRKSDSAIDLNDSGVEIDDTTNARGAEDEGDEGDEWESEDEYDLVQIRDIDGGGIDPYHGLQRPSNIHRDSTDVEFSHRMHNGKPKHAWQVNVRVPPRMRGGVARGKTILKHLRGSLRRPHTSSSSSSVPSFEFRDTQPVPYSVRRQYLELLKDDNNVGEEVVADKLLTPPTRSMNNSPNPSVKRRQTTGSLLNPPTTESQTNHKLSRSRSASQSMPSNPLPEAALHPPSLNHRSRSHSSSHSRHHSHSSQHIQSSNDSAEDETTVAPHSSQTHESSETTVVNHDQYVTDPVLIPLPPSSYFSSSAPSQKASVVLGSSGLSTLSHATSRKTIPSIALRRPKNPQPTRKPIRAPHLAPVLKALAALQRLPWFAEPEAPPGAFLPTGSPPRIAVDFVPARSGRGKLNVKEKDIQKAITWKKSKQSGEDEEEEEEEEGNGSWYKPSTREIQRSMGVMYPSGLHPGVSALGTAYQNYFAALGRTKPRGGRPLGYMYSSPSKASDPASLYSYSYPIRPPPSVSTKGPELPAPSNVSTQPVYPHNFVYQTTQGQQPQQVAYQTQYVYPTFAYNQVSQSFVNRVPGSSPPLPPLPPPTVPSYATYISPSTSSSADSKSLPPLPPVSLGYSISSGGSYGAVLPQSQMRYADYVYSYI